jgi:S1-C subfamily serine protease
LETLRRFALPLLLAAACIVLHPRPSLAAAARSVADTRNPAQEAAYQRLVDATNAVVGIHVIALANARSNETLGVDRVGSGVIIADNLVLTIGYLILEADQVEVTDADGATVPATVLAYDHATGFGLVRPMAPLAQKPVAMGTAAPVAQLDRMIVVSGGAEQTMSVATVVSKRRFAGYWEYLIDDAIFTSPPRLDHSGAALINSNGELVGIGSLFVMDAMTPGEKLPGNMFVPVDLVKPILDEMVRTGAQAASHRPWLGVNSLEEDGRVKVMQVNEESPAADAGIVAGDIILGINGEPVDSLERFYRTLWTRGPAGVDIVLTVLHGPQTRDVIVRSMARQEFMRKRPSV